MTLILLLAVSPGNAAVCPDADGDGFADCTVPGCDTSGVVCGDCDDGIATVHPGAAEPCNHRDDDCDVLVDEDSASVVSTLKLTVEDAKPGDKLGFSMAVLGDVTGDGVADYAACARDGDSEWGFNTGFAQVFSGADGTPVCRAIPPFRAFNDHFGTSIAALGDWDGDGTRDFAVGMPERASGRVLVFRGSDCSFLVELRDPQWFQFQTEDLGYSVASAGDIDGDGRPDIIAGAREAQSPNADHGGAVLVFSGGGNVIRRLTDAGVPGNANLGFSVAGIGDINGDGVPEIAAGAPEADNPTLEEGMVSVFSGATDFVVYRLVDPDPTVFNHFGRRVTAVPDLDGDGVGEIVVGSARRYPALFSGADGSFIRRLTPSDGVGIGSGVSTIDDVDGDGVFEFVLGAGSLPGSEGGGVVVISGADGTTLYVLANPGGEAGDGLGAYVGSIGDVTGDGFPEIVAAAPYDHERGEADVGSVVVFAIESDCDGDGRGPFGGDCVEDDATVYTGAPELCDATDNDCDDVVDEDVDGDGFDACEDCAPTNPTIHPGRAERCNAVDDDCDTEIDEGPDGDGDGHDSPCDCDDLDPGVHDGAAESCDYNDQDCDGDVDEGFAQVLTELALTDPAAMPAEVAGLGTSVAAVGDIDGDGIPDIAAGAPGADRALVYSGADFSVLCRLIDPDPEVDHRFGFDVAGIGDVTNDGVPDIAVGVPDDTVSLLELVGSVHVFSGADCSFVRKLIDPFGRERLGSAVAGIHDMNGDDVQDIVAGAPSHTQVLWFDPPSLPDTYPRKGRAVVFSGADGSVLARCVDPQGFTDDELGHEMMGIGDVTADGTPDIVAHTKDDKAVIFSGADCAFVRRTSGNPDPMHHVAATDDITGDGVPDLVSGSTYADTFAGAINVFSGADGSFVRRHPAPAGLFGVGRSLAELPDMNRDGMPEIVVGVNRPGITQDTGGVVLYSGADGSVVYVMTLAEIGTDFGHAVAHAGDLNDDGLPEVLVGAPETDFDGDGSVYVLSWESDCDGDGYGLVGQDCDDGDPHVNPGAPDPCDGVEGGDCIPGDGTSEDWFGLACDGEDSDACREGVFQCLLGVRVCDDMTINNVELCNGADDDCNGSVDDPLCPFFDVDGDGYIGGAELAWLGRAFGLCSADPATEWWGPIEYTGDGCVDGEDLVVLANLWSASCSGDELICR